MMERLCEVSWRHSLHASLVITTATIFFREKTAQWRHTRRSDWFDRLVSPRSSCPSIRRPMRGLRRRRLSPVSASCRLTAVSRVLYRRQHVTSRHVRYEFFFGQRSQRNSVESTRGCDIQHRVAGVTKFMCMFTWHQLTPLNLLKTGNK